MLTYKNRLRYSRERALQCFAKGGALYYICKFLQNLPKFVNAAVILPVIGTRERQTIPSDATAEHGKIMTMSAVKWIIHFSSMLSDFFSWCTPDHTTARIFRLLLQRALWLVVDLVLVLQTDGGHCVSHCRRLDPLGSLMRVALEPSFVLFTIWVVVVRDRR